MLTEPWVGEMLISLWLSWIFISDLVDDGHRSF